ncbi:MAG: hypothetical protein M0Z77_08420 [Thermoplasmatales archaeon]|nr:hypothetical protein [Candidatus Thermoplasmatota archaeon]MCL6002566.1 hypothetical protein [Candidatus Thermoplasmatota archaeon]MDA8055651.1 hypothetical protein [Thermoplasmatales archaeon]
MGEIYHKVVLKGIRGTARISALLDSGSTFNYIREDLTTGVNVYNDIGIVEFKGPTTAVVGNGEDLTGDAVRFKQAYLLNFAEFYPVFVVSSKLPDDMIIGYLAMQEMRIKLDFDDDRVVPTL